MSEEEWRPVAGFEGQYEVSSLGRVRNTMTGRMLTLGNHFRGYKQIHLFRRKPLRPKTVKVHRLVAQAFLPNPGNLPEVNHKDCDKTNNAVTNLEWVDRMGNYWHAHAAGIWQGGSNPNRITKYSVETIARLRARRLEGRTYVQLAEEFGMNQKYIHRVIKGRSRANG